MPLDIETHQALGLDQPTPREANGHSNSDILKYLEHPGDVAYHPCPEAYPADDVARGTVHKYPDWRSAKAYADTTRSLFVYAPALAEKDQPPKDPGLLFFNDGTGYLARSGPVRAAAVLDSLHAAGEIAPTVAVFLNPGSPLGYDARDRTPGEYDAANLQRSLEYDSLTPTFGEFLLEEVLPFVEQQHGFKITEDPARRTVCGISSGGICAFNLAWQFPEQFGRVLSHCGSYTNIRGGHNFPYLIRSTPRKPLRVFLQSGENDGQTLFGDWPLANKTMANALDYAGYDYRFEFGTGGHSLHHGGALFADSLRWLWQGISDN